MRKLCIKLVVELLYLIRSKSQSGERSKGNFGEVHKGMYNGRVVAVKTCRVDSDTIEVTRKFLGGETTILNFCHPNIVKLIGIAVRSHPIMVIMEYVSGGSLLAYLRNPKNDQNPKLLTGMSLDAANGMRYLEERGCIHRDLAARNCLVADDLQVKIADFGMSRDNNTYELSNTNDQIPIKWTAPEALSKGLYTSKCDVWSYGVLLWEIFAHGRPPYESMDNKETRERIMRGYRLQKPDDMPDWIGTIMNSCWAVDPRVRPDFGDIVIKLEQYKSAFHDKPTLDKPLHRNIT